mmetsp:Transcript_26458/g.61687  ORF Transcript_26458/g.61687 Transcript_26458/m.61687 type:complete len:297 (+) Transcript_26458:1208-2098(+)
MLLRKYCTAACSFSVSVTVLMTPTKMPISMFRTVKLDRKMKTRKPKTRKLECLPMISTFLAGLSRKVPCRSNRSIASATDGISSSSSTFPATCILNTTPKRKSRHSSNDMVTKTERVAHRMPFSSVMASGTKRTSAAMRPNLRRRTSLTMRTTDKPDEALPLPPCTSSITAAKIQVSETMKTTSKVSKQNHLSWMLSAVREYAENLMASSKMKAMQKQLSIIHGCESKPTLDRSSMSACTAIQIVFRKTAKPDITWKVELRTILCDNLSSLAVKVDAKLLFEREGNPSRIFLRILE